MRMRVFTAITLLIGGIVIGGRAEPSNAAQTAEPAALKVVAGDSHTCAIVEGGTVRCWGNNDSSQLGVFTDTRSLEPVTIAGLATVTELSAGAQHTCAINTAGALRCWGSGIYGQLGNGIKSSSAMPVGVIGFGEDTVLLESGPYHTCATTRTTGLRCWGDNGQGELGNNTTVDSATPVFVSGLGGTVTDLALGYDHSCALLAGGAVKCWGSNSSGALGTGAIANSMVPTTVVGLSSGATALSGDQSHTCALMSTGTVSCWGAIKVGLPGSNPPNSTNVPVEVPGLSDVIAINTGGNANCALVRSGEIKCWGANMTGAVGVPNDPASLDGTVLAPVSVSGLGPIVDFAVGRYHGCAVLAGGAIKCWGFNGSGQLGLGEVANTRIPRAVRGLSSNVTMIDNGNGHTCVVDGGAAKCWGLNNSGQLGNNSKIPSLTPGTVQGLDRDVVAVAAGTGYSCALMRGGAVKCWGSNSEGQLGDNSTGSSFVPVDVVGLTNAVAISANYDHTCAITSDGAARCWGDNFNGKVGIGPGGATRVLAPQTVVGLNSGVTQIDTSDDHTCARRATGAVLCWGANREGELGNAGIVTSSVPITVTSFETNASMVATGWYHNCATTSGGAVKCWGNSALGSITTTVFSVVTTPITIDGLESRVASISIGTTHSCVVMTSGAPLCWGFNQDGELGNNSAARSRTPAAVVGIDSGVRQIAAGTASTCALTEAGTVLCWGDNSGVGVMWSNTPRAVVGFEGAPPATPTPSQNRRVLLPVIGR